MIHHAACVSANQLNYLSVCTWQLLRHLLMNEVTDHQRSKLKTEWHRGKSELHILQYEKNKVSNGGCDRVQAHFSTCQLLTDMVLCVPTFKSYDHQNGIQQNMHTLLRMLEWEHLQRGMKHIYLIFSFRSLTSQQSLWLFIMIKSLKYCPHDEGLTNHTSF